MNNTIVSKSSKHSNQTYIVILTYKKYSSQLVLVLTDAFLKHRGDQAHVYFFKVLADFVAFLYVDVLRLGISKIAPV